MPTTSFLASKATLSVTNTPTPSADSFSEEDDRDEESRWEVGG